MSPLQPATVTETVTVTEPAPPEPPCSASGLRIALPDEELPAPVAETRRRVFYAAIACDYDALQGSIPT